MNHSTPLSQLSAETFGTQAESSLRALVVPAASPSRRRGHPLVLSSEQLWLGLLVCLLRGMRAQADLWRLLCWQGFWHFAPLGLSDQAIYKRLAQEGVGTLEQLWLRLSHQLHERLAPYANSQLAPFASCVVALDETVLDPLARLLAPLRGWPVGDPHLLPGKIAAVFDVRLQLWRDFRFVPEALANCKVHAQELLRTLPRGSLLLHDRGFFSFPWFDELTRLGYWWICRQRDKTRTTLIHVYYHVGDTFDGLVWLGATRDQAACAVRLVQFRCHGRRYTYLTNVLDPRVLSMQDIARLYARRWDSELAFRTLKEHLGLRLLWSSKLVVLQQQCLACLLLAQLLQAFQVELAARAEVDPFDVSIPLLLKVLPHLLSQGLDPMETLLHVGRQMGVIRPHSRQLPTAPFIPLWEMILAPPDLVLVRQARYAHSNPHHKRSQKPI